MAVAYLARLAVGAYNGLVRLQISHLAVALAAAFDLTRGLGVQVPQHCLRLSRWRHIGMLQRAACQRQSADERGAAPHVDAS